MWRFLKFTCVLVASVAIQSTNVLAESARDLRKNHFIYDWSAMGSGCRGRISALEGAPVNVRFHLSHPTPGSPSRYHLRFFLDKFKLESPVPKDQGQTNLEFARDCAIRVALNPPSGKKIKYIEAQSFYTLSKSPDTEMATLASLSLGMSTLDTVRMDFPKSESFSSRQKELKLTPGPIPENSMPETKCGQSKLLGLDLLFYVNRPNELAKNSMVLTKDSKFDIFVELEDCE